MTTDITFTLNGSQVSLSVDGHLRLVDLLRDQLNQTGTKVGCGEGECGACTVLVNGRAVNSCLFPAPEIDGCQVTTIEGLLEQDNKLSKIQQAFVDNGGIQCGFCSPGMMMQATHILKQNPNADREQIQRGLEGNLCRCTGYKKIVDAVASVSKHED